MTSERGTRATSPWASPDGTAYQVVSERRSADPPTGRVNDHGGGGGGASSGGPSSVGGAGLGGGGGGGGAAGGMIEIEGGGEKPGRSRSGWGRGGEHDRDRGGGREPRQFPQRLGQQRPGLQLGGRQGHLGMVLRVHRVHR